MVQFWASKLSSIDSPCFKVEITFKYLCRKIHVVGFYTRGGRGDGFFDRNLAKAPPWNSHRKKSCGGVLSSPENSKNLLYHPTEKNSGGVVTTPSTLGDLGDVWNTYMVWQSQMESLTLLSVLLYHWSSLGSWFHSSITKWRASVLIQHLQP